MIGQMKQLTVERQRLAVLLESLAPLDELQTVTDRQERFIEHVDEAQEMIQYHDNFPGERLTFGELEIIGGMLERCERLKYEMENN